MYNTHICLSRWGCLSISLSIYLSISLSLSLALSFFPFFLCLFLCKKYSESNFKNKILRNCICMYIKCLLQFPTMKIPDHLL